jgi:hypothetical protein
MTADYPDLAVLLVRALCENAGFVVRDRRPGYSRCRRTNRSPSQLRVARDVAARAGPGLGQDAADILLDLIRTQIVLDDDDDVPGIVFDRDFCRGFPQDALSSALKILILSGRTGFDHILFSAFSVSSITLFFFNYGVGTIRTGDPRWSASGTV